MVLASHACADGKVTVDAALGGSTASESADKADSDGLRVTVHPAAYRPLRFWPVKGSGVPNELPSSADTGDVATEHAADWVESDGNSYGDAYAELCKLVYVCRQREAFHIPLEKLFPAGVFGDASWGASAAHDASATTGPYTPECNQFPLFGLLADIHNSYATEGFMDRVTARSLAAAIARSVIRVQCMRRGSKAP